MTSETLSIILKDGALNYTLERRPKRKKTIAIIISREKGVIVRAPLRAPEERINTFLNEKAGWIKKKLQETEAKTPAAKKYENGELFKFLGHDYPLILETKTIKRKAAARFSSGCLFVKIPPNISDEQRASWVRESLKYWYRPRANNYLNKAVNRLSNATGLNPLGMRVKDLRRSWGICNKGHLSLNWRLVLAPARLIDYVVIHELCHLRHANHSKAFWLMVHSFMPDYQSRRKALRDIEPRLDL